MSLTNILILPEVSLTLTVERDADVVESLGYFDSAGNPVDLTGITFILTIRKSLTGPVVFQGSTLTGDVQLLSTPQAPLVPSAWAWVAYEAYFPLFLRVGEYFHNMQAVADGRVRTVSSGPLYVVTRGAD